MKINRSSCYGTMGLAASLQHQGTGLIPSLAQWVKGSHVSAAAAQIETAAWILSLAWELNMPKGDQKKKEKKENKYINRYVKVVSQSLDSISGDQEIRFSRTLSRSILSTYYISGIILGTKDMTIKQIRFCPLEAYIQMEDRFYTPTNTCAG